MKIREDETIDMSFESFVARRYLRIKHERRMVPIITILATLGVSVGVMVLVVVIAVMSGFQSELKARILGIESHVLVMRFNEWIVGYDRIVEQVRQLPGVRSASPYIYAQGMLRSTAGVLGLQLKGIDPRTSHVQLTIQGTQNINALLESNDGESPEHKLVLGKVLAEKLNLTPGAGVMLMVAGARDSDPRRPPKMHRLKVVGLFDTGMHQYDANFGFVHIADLQNFMGIANTATGIEVKVDDVDRVEEFTGKITAKIGERFWVANWKQMHRNLFSMLGLQKVVMFIIMTLIIVVAAFNVASALIMVVREKTREIAIFKAMGATDRSMKKIFMVKGLIIGLSGIALGVFGGLSLCWLLSKYRFIELPGDVYFLTTLPVRITLFDMGCIILGALLICLTASLYPAAKAAKMSPVDAIRYG
jgi:lipoprotein-releasing system permease protein